MSRITSMSAPIAHLIGPGKIKIVNGRLAFSAPDQAPLRIDLDSLRSVFCYGAVGLTDQALVALLQHRVAVAWLSPAGHHCRGRLVGKYDEMTRIRMLQHHVLNTPRRRLELARSVVLAKIDSQRHAARHYQRQGVHAAGPALARLGHARQRCQTAADIAQLNGCEGAASQAWFDVLGGVLQPPWEFVRRVRRPPTDPVNALLSLGYTWLLNRTVAWVQAVGLEVSLGALHEFHPGRPSLACDLMESLRTPAVDRWLIRVCNRRELHPKDFQMTDHGVRLRAGVFGRVLATWEQHWTDRGQEHALQQQTKWFIQELRQSDEGEVTGDTGAATQVSERSSGE